MLPVYILMRTSNRPKFFKNAVDSVRKQTYKNVVLMVHYDDKNDLNYVEGDILLYSARIEPHKNITAPYNLYCNKMLESIPDGPGWYHFLDDDDQYSSENVIENLVEKSLEDHINIGRVKRWDDLIFPDNWGSQLSFQTECFFLHTNHKLKAQWPFKKAGDHFYSKQLTRQLPINWIDGLLIAEAQQGKGAGKRLDFDDCKTGVRS